MANVVFLDNFDSFTYNLVDQFRVLGHKVLIYRNNTPIDVLLSAAKANKDTIVALSPGPGTPQDAGNMMEFIHQIKNDIPVLGICLGHQALIASFGGKVTHAGEVLHGKASMIKHDQQFMFADLPNPMAVARYHSLMGVDLPAELIVNASVYSEQKNGGAGEIVMSFRHKTLPIAGFQFHPESILTVNGGQLISQTIDWLLKGNNNAKCAK